MDCNYLRLPPNAGERDQFVTKIGEDRVSEANEWYRFEAEQKGEAELNLVTVQFALLAVFSLHLS